VRGVARNPKKEGILIKKKYRNLPKVRGVARNPKRRGY
jgi:hypothetical protein